MQIIKKIIILLILVAIVLYANASVFAVTDTNKYNPKGKQITAEDKKVTGEIIGQILGIIKTIGVSIAVIMLAIIGIKFMLGSVDEKATYKENMFPYIAGCLLLASASTIPSFIYNIVTK